VKNKAAATQAEVDAATTALTTATSAFDAAKKDGTATDGTAPVSLTFWVNKDNQILASNNSVTISKTSADDYTASFTAEVISEYDSVTWSVNGAPESGNKTIEITATDYPNGTYRLGVIVVKNNVPYSTEITFTVRN
jgi:hypothetical protein